jgi:hypothetical protein
MIISFGASVLITGCGEEDITDPDEEMAEPQETVMEKRPPSTLQFTFTPAAGAVISSNQEFTLTFDIAVIEVTVNGIAATDTKAGGFGGVWIVSLTLEPGARDLAVEWTEKSNGCVWVQAVGPYTVVADED